MAHTTQFLTYYIVLTDPDLVKQYQAQFPFGYQFAPYNPNPIGGAAIAFQAPWSGSSPGAAAPYTWSPVWTAQNNYPQNVATFQRRTGGFWGIGGDTVTYYWIGQFELAPQPTVNKAVPPAIAPIPKRRWSEGFEVGGAGTFNDNGIAGQWVSRDASRHVGGYGLAMRGSVVSPAVQINVARYIPAYQPLTSWERMYLRCRQVDLTQDVPFWEVFGTAGGNVGVQCRVVASGTPGHWQIAVYRKQAGVYAFKQTIGDFVIFDGSDTTWNGFYKVDWLIKYSTGGSGGTLRMFVNGVLTGTVPFTVAEGGLGFEPAFHRGSGLGNAQGVANVLHLDIDDWVGADVPNIGGVETLTSKDWLGGSKLRLVRPKQFSVNHDAVAWPGDVRVLMQNPLSDSQLTISPVLASTTASGVCEVDTDSDLSIDADRGNQGVAAITVSIVSSSALGTDGQLGYGLNGAAPVLAVVDQQVAQNDNQVQYSVDGTTTTPADVTPLRLRFVKAADANAVNLQLLLAQAELIGAWGIEDYRVSENGTGGTPTFDRWMGQHNAPYPRSEYAIAPRYSLAAPYAVYGRSYVGNNVAQDLTFNAPIHWLFIRPATGNLGGFQWFSTCFSGHKIFQVNHLTEIVDVDEDPTFVPGVGIDIQQKRYRVRITSADAQLNATGVTYELIAVSDPGGRFMLNMAMTAIGAEVSKVVKLENAGFTPEFAFIKPEGFEGTGAGNLYIRGLGSLATDVSDLSAGAKIASALSFGAGAITTQANLHAKASGRLAFSLWRRHDGNNDPGEPAVVSLLSWTGDGSGSRTITNGPATGKRPLFAWCAGDTAADAYWRDPVHAGSNSSKQSGAETTTGITGGGIDTISVGASLNTNAVNYNMFVLWGSATAGNNGWSPNGDFVPVQADYPVDGPVQQPPDPSVFIQPAVSIPLDGEPDLEHTIVLSDIGTDLGGLVGGQVCEFYTRHCVNMALSRIGISKRIASLATDNTLEAAMARAHILEDVNATLRAFDWPFATRYASLVLVAGTATVPVNQDWQYSYRAPNAMIKARRLVNQDGSQRNFDRNPPKFKVGSDDIGPLIFTNDVATAALPLVLEYTIRNLCPAFYGDAMFRNALAWRFAESLAPTLSKDTKKQDYCRARFEAAIAAAKVPAAQEQQQAPSGDAGWISDRG